MTRRDPLPVPGITLGERLVCALLGAFFGALLGVIGAWMLSVSLDGFRFALVDVSYPKAALVGAAFCAAIGLVFGRSAGTFIGHVFSGLFTFSRWDSWTPPWWVWAGVLALIAYTVLR